MIGAPRVVVYVVGDIADTESITAFVEDPLAFRNARAGCTSSRYRAKGDGQGAEEAAAFLPLISGP
ncbi:hypothetical protein ACLMAL_11350 [Nocardia sp. CWNU-33]|uniref:hypothetical protein n=1 Tax=Nocardia sp. CWNU-33 TaxID=3392117 RepID=UPI00398F35EA